jgi:hypothetical protein
VNIIDGPKAMKLHDDFVSFYIFPNRKNLIMLTVRRNGKVAALLSMNPVHPFINEEKVSYLLFITILV